MKLLTKGKSMKNIFKIPLLLSLLISSYSSSSQVLGSKCDRILTHSGNIQIWREWSASNRVCEVSIHPMSVQDLIYRDYYISSVGTFMVFNSYGEGPDSETTGAREFIFVPRINSYLEVSILPNEDVQVVIPTGQKIIFDALTAQIKSLSEGTIKVQKNVLKTNSGGVEILSSLKTWIDFGFRMGSSPMGNLNGSNTVKDLNGKSCRLKNKDLVQSINQDPQFYRNDDELKILFSKKCTGLSF